MFPQDYNGYPYPAGQDYHHRDNGHHSRAPYSPVDTRPTSLFRDDESSFVGKYDYGSFNGFPVSHHSRPDYDTYIPREEVYSPANPSAHQPYNVAHIPVAEPIINSEYYQTESAHNPPESPLPSQYSPSPSCLFDRAPRPLSDHYNEIPLDSFDSIDNYGNSISMSISGKKPLAPLDKIDAALSGLREYLESKHRKSLEHRLAKTRHYYQNLVYEMRDLRAQWESNAARLVTTEKACARHTRKREEALQTIEDQKETIARLEQQVKQQTAEEREWADLQDSAKELQNTEKTGARYKRKRDKALQTVAHQKETIGRLGQQVKLLTTGEGSWPDLEVGDSKIPGAGDGLFTKYPIPQGVIIGEYYGEPVFRMAVGEDSHVVWKKGPEFLKDDTYVVWIKKEVKKDGVWIKINKEKGVDGDYKGGHEDKTILRKMNHSENNNTDHFVCDDGTVKFYTTRPIEAGEELLWDYDQEIETDFEKGVKKRIVQNPHQYVKVVNGNVTLKKAKRSHFDASGFIRQ